LIFFCHFCHYTALNNIADQEPKTTEETNNSDRNESEDNYEDNDSMLEEADELDESQLAELKMMQTMGLPAQFTYGRQGVTRGKASALLLVVLVKMKHILCFLKKMLNIKLIYLYYLRRSKEISFYN